MKVNSAIMLSHHYFFVIIWKDLELDDFTIQSSETFKRELWSVIDFYLRSVDTSGHEVTLIFGYFNLIGGRIEWKILNELDSAFEFFIIF